MTDAPTTDTEDRESVHKPDDPLLAQICERWEGCGWDDSHGDAVAIVPTDSLVDIAQFLRDEEHFAMCVDVTSVDYLDQWDRTMGTYEGEPTRYEVVVNVLDLGTESGTPRRLRLRVPVDEDDPRCPSLAFVWPLADSAEREVYDLMGIVFDGHPDLTRVLMPDDWEGHPLRKDYGMGRIPVAFRDDSVRDRPQPVRFLDRAGRAGRTPDTPAASDDERGDR